ncbi:excinuclease ABC, C subunit [Bacteriovorax sp. BSW11_IV]|uniref:excinuclease ABC subunit UvrC n=1 Tax=Bacteriovorax sp. BSW11_IV TaxID=1353529 RepID=UPI00038A2162|nr:excinuclease ABC subunit UvrC [Bacteriovorax sp. BSW11_IV]EQC43609.1 excinuclease ABC, C subunit [Bacteriovorax sp. BSW11_IV]
MSRVKTTMLEKANTFPKLSGCYLLKKIKNDEEVVLYVGKAKNLKNRVTSYFNNSVKTPKTEILVSHVNEIDFIITENESEALVLENNLIKKYSPKYNIRMKDDKSYPYVVVNFNEAFPRLQFIRNVKRQKGIEVFGPFVHGSNISEILKILTKSFTLRDCTLREFQSRKEPCILYQMKQCSAPCVDYISQVNYLRDLNLALNIFKGKGEESLEVLVHRMITAADNEEFEKAALLRDYIKLIKDFIDFSKQKNAELDSESENIDVIAYHKGDVEIDISIYMTRQGILLGHKSFHFPVIEINDELEDEILNFMFQYYCNTNDLLPKNIICDFEPERLKVFESALRSALENKIVVRNSGRKYSSLMKLTNEHAREHQRVRSLNEESVYVGLNRLKELLGLPERPVLLECFDVAIFQGSSPTASQIVFHDGRADKKSYRYYHLNERPEGNNDFAMMKEMLARRLKHGKLPDVFIVDGGKGQVSMFLEVLKEFDLSVPVVGIAKSKVDKKSNFRSSEITRSEERLIIPGRANPFILKKCKSLFKIVTSMRDEAHRFSRKLHHKAEKKKLFTGWIDQIEGVGPKTKKAILEKLDITKDELKKMNATEISQYLGVNKDIADKILKVLS